MTDAEIVALAWLYYKAGRASAAEADGIPTRDEVIASRLILAIRIGQCERQKPKLSGWDYVATHVKRVARPLLLERVVDDLAMLLGGDRRRAAELADGAFMKGWRKRHLDQVGWIKRAVTEEERYSVKLLTTEPTSLDDCGVRKARQRAVKWFKKQGRVVYCPGVTKRR
jgi:hypothetical protein